jgi:hypothetical protein
VFSGLGGSFVPRLRPRPGVSRLIHAAKVTLRVGLTLIDMGEAEPYAIIIHTNPSGVPSAARASLGQLDLPR